MSDSRSQMKALNDLFLDGKERLGGDADAGLESRMLLMKAASLTREQFYASSMRPVSMMVWRRFRRLIKRRMKGIPLAYLIKEKEFWSHSFLIQKNVLIPRPETELIIETVLSLTDNRKGQLADLGTGSGNIALSLARELPDFKITATDISRAALRTAQANARRMSQPNVRFVRGAWFKPLKVLGLEGSLDFIVSNPPYVSVGEWVGLQKEIKEHEPKSALVSGKNGLEDISIIIRESPVFLKPGGYLVMEIGFRQREKVLSLFGEGWGRFDCLSDLSGIPRVVVAQSAPGGG